MADASAPEPIKTKRLILREARKFDLGAMHKLYSNKEVMRFWYVSLVPSGASSPLKQASMGA